jgi:hypothetical protein
MSEWMQALEYDPQTDGKVCLALCEGGPTVVPRVLKGLQRRDDSAIYKLFYGSLPVRIQRSFHHPRCYNSYRYCCAFILGFIDPSTPEIVRALRQSLTYGDSGEARFAAQALRMIALREPRMRVDLQKALPDLQRWVATPGPHYSQVARSIQCIEDLKGKKVP